MTMPNPILFYDNVANTYQLEFVPPTSDEKNRILGRVRIYDSSLEGIAEQIKVNQENLDPLKLMPGVPKKPISQNEVPENYAPVTHDQVLEVLSLLRI